MTKIILYADGGSRGNPGPAAAGAVLYDDSDQIVASLKSDLGRATNNQAEYAAVILGLEKALESGATEIQIKLDSKLVVEQLAGRWKIKDLVMRKYVEKAHVSLAKLKSWSIQHIPREQNTEADALVNAVLDVKCGPKKVWRGSFTSL